MEVKSENHKVSHAPELREILQKKPFAPIRWGNTVILFFLFGLFILSNMVLLPLPFRLKAKMVDQGKTDDGKLNSLIFETNAKTKMVIKSGDSIKIWSSSLPNVSNRAAVGIVKSAETLDNEDKRRFVLIIEPLYGPNLAFQEGEIYHLSIYKEKTFMGWIRNDYP